jgi:prepilin-type N-terminal cleavage/methylation domain-containing protein
LRYPKNDSHKGFTIVETLVAISIFLIVIVGPMTIASRGMQSSYYANEQMTAVFLAQEGLEGVRHLRDNKALEVVDARDNVPPDTTVNTTDWYTELPTACRQTNTKCDYDWFNGENAFKSCGSTNSCLLKQDTSRTDRVYGYGNSSSWTYTPFTRKIYVGPYSNGGWPITVTVSWKASASLFGTNNDKSITLQSWVYDQYAQ